MNETHNPATESWVQSANVASADFPIQNLPFGICRPKGTSEPGNVCIAIGDAVLNVDRVSGVVPFEGYELEAVKACKGNSLNHLMSLDPDKWSSLRRRLFALLRSDGPDSAENQRTIEPLLLPATQVEMLLPASIGDYTDFYASLNHATNVGTMLRPENPLFPNYKHLPVAYHGRSSSIVVSGTAIRRPSGQTRDESAPSPVFGPSRQMDYELEMGFFVGRGNTLGETIDVEDAESHIFGLCLLNDWSARDIQKWEYQPLGPFLAKNFATSISPWVVTLEALEPFRVPATARPTTDPAILPHLNGATNRKRGAMDITLEVSLRSKLMRETRLDSTVLTRSNLKHLYWTLAQMLAHHSSNGCNLRPGDLMGTGTVSGPTKDSRGCLLELTWRGSEPIQLPSGEQRKFLQDNDEVTIRGWCEHPGYKRVGFGECRGMVVGAEAGGSH
jgi:fumarylacetoacetase